MKRVCVALVGLACLFSGALAQSANAFEGVSRHKRGAIVGGTPSNQENVVYVRAGIDLEGVEPRACTGTLVAPHLILTARHCVSYFSEGDFFCTVDGDIDKTRPRQPANAGEVGLPYAPRQIQFFFPPSPPLDYANPELVAVRVFAPETSTICRNDIALVEVELSDDAKARGLSVDGIEPAALRIAAGVIPGERLRLVGYGTNDDALDQQEELASTTILAVGPSEYFPVDGLALPRTFAVGRGPCPGDSGGPAFSEETGALLGVYSLFRGSCRSEEARNFYTQVAPFRTFIDDVFEKVGERVRVEEGEAGAPSTGTGGAEGLGGEGGMVAEQPPSPGCSVARTSRHLYAGPALVIILGMAAFCRRRVRGRDDVERS